VAAVLAAAANEGLGYREVAALDNGEIRHLLFPELEEKVSGYTQPDFEWVHKELGRTGVTLFLLSIPFVPTWGSTQDEKRLIGQEAFNYASPWRWLRLSPV
jgi:hypothetical protein